MADEVQAASSPANPTEYLASLDATQLADWRAGKLPEPQKAEEKPNADGAAPSKESTTKEPSVNAGEPADKTAAESETAHNQEPKKGKRDAQSRILQLLADKKAADARADAAERKLADRDRNGSSEKKEVVTEPEKKTDSKAAKETRPKPKQTDTNPDGTDKFASFADFAEDLADWKTEQKLEAFKAEQSAEKTESAKTAEKNKQQEESQKAWAKRVEDAEKKYPDFKTVALNNDLPVAAGSPVFNFVGESPSGMDVLYYLGENPDELIRINALPAYEQLGELFEIARDLKAAAKKEKEAETPSGEEKPTVPLIKNTRTAKPPTEASGRSSAPDDPVEAALRNRDAGAYMRLKNREEYAAKQKK